MISPVQNERSDESQAGTSGLHASRLEEQKKRKTSCSSDAQLKRQKIDRKRKRSNDEESEPSDYQTKKLETSEVYSASGLKSSLHGVAYQLKLLMLFLKRGVDQGYPFRLATEMDAAEKFDDLVFQYRDGEKTVHRFLQAKHKLDKAKQISINDLLTDTGKKLNLQKYFISYRKLKRNPEFNCINDELKDLIICTNIGLKLDDKRGALTLNDDIFHRERDETILKTDLRRFKKDFNGREDIVSALENATDLIKLAENLAGYILDDECTKKGTAEKKTSDDFLKSYQFPLEEQVIDRDRKKLRREFVTCAEGLSLEAKNFRQAIEKVFRDQRKTYNLHTDPVIKRENLDKFAQVVAALIQEGKGSGIIKIDKRKNVIKENFGKLAGYVLVKKAGKIRFSLAFLNKDKLPGNLDDFREKLLAELLKKNITPNDIAEYIFQVYKDFQTCDEIHVNMNTFWEVIGEKKFDLFHNSGTWDTDLESVDLFVENLVHLIEESRTNGKMNVEIRKENKIFKNMIKLAKYALIEENDTIRFNHKFLEDALLPDNLKKFRDQLKSRVEDLGELRFLIHNFPKTRLPSDSITDIDSEIQSFLDKLVFAVDQPNEIVLGNTIDTEMGNCRGINLIDSDFLASYFQRYVFDWMKDKNGRFLTCVEGKDFFDNMEKKVTSLQLTWLTREYSANMEQIDIRFNKDEIELQKFLEPENTTQLFILMSMPDTILGLIQVHQILKKIPDYQKDDAYIFLRFNSFLCMQSPVIDAFASRSKRLLIIECQSIEVNEKASYRELLEAIKSNNPGKIILVTEKDNMLANQFKWMSDGRYFEKKMEVNSLLDLENESRIKIIKKRIVIFQGQEVPLSKLIMNEESMNLINAEALVKLINNEILEIGKRLEDLGDVGDYYIRRTFQRQEKINQSFHGCESKFYVTINNHLKDFDPQQNQDIVVISDSNKLFKELGNEKNDKEHNIHWLKSKNGQFIWQESNGAVTKLRDFVDSNSVESFIPEKVTDISNKIAIIAAEPGMGKSTVLTYLSVQTKKSEPTLWVAKINLSVDCSKKLKEMVDGGIRFDDEKTIDFLLASAKLTSEMLEYQFLNYCYKTGNMITLFDGFDEISPHYNNKVIELLKFLKGTRVKKIWVTTRPYNIRNNLEDELGSFSYVLKEFSGNDQRRFLREFWTAKLNSDNFDDRRANVFIDTLLDSFSKSINDRERRFISIPLQIRMIADVCKDTFQNFHKSHDENIADSEKQLEKNLELMSLYENFFEVKFRDIVFGEKQPGSNPAQSYVRDIMDRERENVVEAHEILALENLYPNNSFIPRKKLIRLLEDIKRSKNKTGIIDRVVDDKPVFVHKSFAEYFVALWFSENWREDNVKQFLIKYIFNKESIVILNFLNRMLAKDEPESSQTPESYIKYHEGANEYKLHKAVLNNNMSEVHRLLNKDKSLLDTTDKAGRTPVHLAAARGHMDIAQSLLKVVKESAHHSKINPLSVKDELFKWTPLAYADKNNHWDVAELLLQMGAASEDMFEAKKNIKKVGTLLHKAAKKGYFKIAELLLEGGVMIDARDEEKRTPLHLAALQGHIEVVKYFANEQNANYGAVDEKGNTPLHYAASTGSLEVVKYLVDEKYAKLQAVNREGKSPLNLAVREGNQDVVMYLYSRMNAESKGIAKKGTTPLHFAAWTGDFKKVKYLVDEKKANFEAIDEEGNKPLHFAVWKGNLEMVKLLVEEKNANFEALDGKGRTLLHTAATRGNLEIVKYLVDMKNANFEAVDGDGSTPLHLAAWIADLKIVKYLVDEKKANFEAVNGNGSTPLHLAAWIGDLKIVKYLVDEKKANFKAIDKEGNTPLHFAAWMGDLEMVKYLVDEKKANFEAVNRKGNTPLHSAVWTGNLEIVKHLVEEKKANVEGVDGEGNTLLHIAAARSNFEIVKYLVDEKNANFEAFDGEGNTPLHLAASKGDLQIVKFLVNEKKANFEAVDGKGNTPLHFAVWTGNLEIVEHLVEEKKANFEVVDGKGNTLLHMAAAKGNLKIVRYLVDKKNANFEAVNGNGNTPLHFAASKSNLQIVEYLVDEKKANFETVNDKGNTPLHRAASEGNLEIVKHLVDKKNANFEAVNGDGNTPLHFAAWINDLEMVNYLVDEKNANLEAVDDKGNTPLHRAALEGNLEIVKLLVEEKKANLEAVEGKRSTLLHKAAAKGNLDIVEYLVDEQNANFEAVDDKGHTPLHRAALKGNFEIVKFLVEEKKANFEAVDRKGNTLLHMAAAKGNSEIVKYLVDKKNANFEAINGNGNTALHFAAWMGDLKMVKYLVDEKKANSEAVDGKGNTPLHCAASKGNLQIVEYFVNERNSKYKARN